MSNKGRRVNKRLPLRRGDVHRLLLSPTPVIRQLQLQQAILQQQWKARMACSQSVQSARSELMAQTASRNPSCRSVSLVQPSRNTSHERAIGAQSYVCLYPTQCLSTKQVGNPPNNRYRAIVSDSQTFIQAMFATQLNPLVESNEVQKNALMKITEYTVNAVKDRT